MNTVNGIIAWTKEQERLKTLSPDPGACRGLRIMAISQDGTTIIPIGHYCPNKDQNVDIENWIQHTHSGVDGEEIVINRATSALNIDNNVEWDSASLLNGYTIVIGDIIQNDIPHFSNIHLTNTIDNKETIPINSYNANINNITLTRNISIPQQSTGGIHLVELQNWSILSGSIHTDRNYELKYTNFNGTMQGIHQLSNSSSNINGFYNGWTIVTTDNQEIRKVTNITNYDYSL